MAKIQAIKNKLFLVKARDLWGFVLILLALFPALILKSRHKKIWLFCERHEEARDNAFALFRYVQEEVPTVAAYYAIDFTSKDYKKVAPYGKHAIRFGSFRHYLYYLACDANVSSVKNCGPNNLVGFVFRKLNLMNNKVCFLQHGTIMNRLDWLFYPETKMRVFCCSAVPEFEFVRDHFGYPEDNLIYNGGQARFDNFYLPSTTNLGDYLLVMPTWRMWLKPGDPHLEEIEGTTDFTKTNYFQHWTSFLNSPELERFLEQARLRLIFYPHPTMQEYVANFKSKNQWVTIAKEEEWDLPELVKNAKALVTDYTSVYFDFVYTGKQVYSYQFDIAQFTKHHYATGYLPYTDNPFLIACPTEQSLLTALENGAKDDFSPSQEFMQERDRFFPTRDNHNCERIYQNIYDKIYES